MNIQIPLAGIDDHQYLPRFFAFWITWVIVVASLALFAEQLGFDFYGSQPYNWLSALSPGMQRLPVGAHNESVAAALWVYSTYSFPFAFCIALRRIDHCRLQPELWKNFLALTITAVLGVLAGRELFIADTFDVNSSSAYLRMYRRSVIGTLLIPVIVGGGFLLMSINVALHVREYWRRISRRI
jgi:hypothetical protein